MAWSTTCYMDWIVRSIYRKKANWIMHVIQSPLSAVLKIQCNIVVMLGAWFQKLLIRKFAFIPPKWSLELGDKYRWISWIKWDEISYFLAKEGGNL